VSETERRAQARVPVDMWVEEEADNAVYFQRSANVSSGGLFLEYSVPHPTGTRVRIRFTLPGIQGEVTAHAEIVKADGGLGMHLKFLDLGPDAAARIEQYIARARMP